MDQREMLEKRVDDAFICRRSPGVTTAAPGGGESAMNLSCSFSSRIAEFAKDVQKDRILGARKIQQKLLGTDEMQLCQIWRKESSLNKSESGEYNAAYLTWRVWSIKRSKNLLQSSGQQRFTPAEKTQPEHLTQSPSGLQSVRNWPSDDSGSQFLLGVPYPSFKGSKTKNQRSERRYIALISMNGLVSGKTYGDGNGYKSEAQVDYVVELGRSLARHPLVHRVDIFTRIVSDSSVDVAYSNCEETLIHTDGTHGGAYIIRVPCGPSDKYLREEYLWPYVYEFADNAVESVKQRLSLLSEAGEACELYAIHGHHANGGEVAALMAHTIGADMVMTGHNLGRNRLNQWLTTGTFSHQKVAEASSISRMIEGEERALDVAMVVFSSTTQEVNDQWALYDGYPKKTEEWTGGMSSKRMRLPMMATIPPGLDIRPSLKESIQDRFQLPASLSPSAGMKPHAAMPGICAQSPGCQEISRFLVDNSKPIVLAICHSSHKENVFHLLDAYGSCPQLQSTSNLVLLLRVDKDESPCSSSDDFIKRVLKSIDDFDLYGNVAYPKNYCMEDLPAIFGLVASTRGVYVNGDPYRPFEPFLSEAAYHGIPVVALQSGTPIDIMTVLENGVFVDSNDQNEVSKVLVRIMTDSMLWDSLTRKGLENLSACSWSAHCHRYMETIDGEKERKDREQGLLAEYTGSWDGSAFKRILDGGFVGDSDVLNNGLAEFLSKSTEILAVDSLGDPGWGDFLNLEADVLQQPRISTRKSVCAFSFDNQASARLALKVLKSIAEQIPTGKSVAGLGVVSMLGYDPTCLLIEQAAIDIGLLDFIICSGGVDLFVWAGDDMVFYDPFDEHVGEYWVKSTLQKLLDSIPNGDENDFDNLLKPYKDVHGSSDYGPYHIIMELSRGARPSADEVALSDVIKRRIRRAGIRANIVLQVDESPRGATTTPIVHVTPLRACRSQALRFLMCQIGIPMSEVTIVCCATSLVESAKHGSRKVGFAVSDMAPLLEGSQKVVVVPPNEETQVRHPKDGLDAKMIEKLKYEIGKDLYGERVMMIGQGCEILSRFVGATLALGGQSLED